MNCFLDIHTAMVRKLKYMLIKPDLYENNLSESILKRNYNQIEI